MKHRTRRGSRGLVIRRAAFGLPALSLLLGGCLLAGELPGVFQNPSCQTVHLSFRDTGLYYRAAATVPNPISNQYRLARVTISDGDGWQPESITLTAPLGAKGDRCSFGFPAPQSGLAAEQFADSIVFTAVNPPLDSAAECSVLDHLGAWTLEVVYPKDVAVAAPFVKQMTMCFEFSTSASRLRAGG